MIASGRFSVPVVAAKGTELMSYPWKENATLVRMAAADRTDNQAPEILFEGSLIVLAKRVHSLKPLDRRGLRISLPDRQVRPHTFQDDSLTALIDSIPNL